MMRHCRCSRRYDVYVSFVHRLIEEGDMNPRTARRLAIASATVLATYLWSIGAQATGTGKSFTSLAAGFTQDLYGVTEIGRTACRGRGYSAGDVCGHHR